MLWLFFFFLDGHRRVRVLNKRGGASYPWLHYHLDNRNGCRLETKSLKLIRVIRTSTKPFTGKCCCKHHISSVTWLHSTSEYIKNSQMELYLKKNNNNTNNTASKLTNNNKISSVSLSPHILSSNIINKIHGNKNANTCCSTKCSSILSQGLFCLLLPSSIFQLQEVSYFKQSFKKFIQTHIMTRKRWKRAWNQC